MVVWTVVPPAGGRELRMPFKESEHPRDSRGRFVTKEGLGGIGALIVLVVLATIGSGDPGAATDGGGSWSRSGLQFSRQDHQAAGDCAAHAHGKVQLYLREHPCVRLCRARFTGEDGHGHTMTVTTQVVTMPDTGQAAQLKRLVDRPGTGNIDKLGTDTAAASFDSRRTGRTVVIAEAVPQSFDSVPSAVLDTAATAGVRLPTE